MIGVLVDEQLTQSRDHIARPRGREHLGDLGDELVQPGRWVLEPRGEVLALHERPPRMPLPASRTHTVALVAAQLAASLADSRWILRWSRPGTRPAPSGLGTQIAGFAAPRAALLAGE